MRIFSVYLNDRKVAGSGRERFDDDAEQGSVATDAGGIGLTGGGDNGLAMLFIHALNNRNFLGSTGEGAAVANLFDADDRRVVLQQHRNGEEIVYIFDDDAESCTLPRAEVQR